MDPNSDCPSPAAGHFRRAIEHCRDLDVHEAANCFFAALSAADSRFDVTFTFVNGQHRTIEIAERLPADTSPEDWVRLARNFADEWCDLLSGETIPPALEAMTLALVRLLCHRGEVESAHALTQGLLSVSRLSIHLRAAEAAIGLLLQQKPVPAHLRRFVGPDGGAMADRFCPVPFARVDIHQSGEVAMCCTHWLPTNIGNVFNGQEILNSDVAKDIRRSVVDGSFKYCSHADCELITNDKLPRKAEYVGKPYDDEHYHIDERILSDAFDLTAFEIPNISYLIFCLDRSCNLSCPSCRTDVIMVKGEERDKLYEATENTVLPMLRNAKRVMVNPSGEVFLSRPSRRLLEKLADPEYQGLKVDIITNGTLCGPKEWDKFAHLYRRIGYIRVSLDGASKDVIEKLRRGADFEQLVANLENLARMHREGLFKNFFASFTYQRDNLQDMDEFLSFTQRFTIGTVIFERLQNIGTFTDEEYRDRAVHLVDHPRHAEFQRIARAMKRDPRVYIDFDTA